MTRAGLSHPDCPYAAAYFPSYRVWFCNKCGWSKEKTNG